MKKLHAVNKCQDIDPVRCQTDLVNGPGNGQVFYLEITQGAPNMPSALKTRAALSGVE